MNSINETFGFIALAITILLWGSWLAISKKDADKLNNPYKQNLLITIGALFINFVIAIFYFLYSGEEINISVGTIIFPIISGILWAIAGLTAMISIAKLGVGRALSIWAPAGMIVSFLWGILYYKEFSESYLYAVISMALIIIGTILVIKSKNQSENSKIVKSGVIAALFSSLIWGGTYLVPIKELSETISPFYTLLPLNIGMVIGALGIFFLKSEDKKISVLDLFNFNKIVISGGIWAIGNMFAVIAVMSLGMGKAYPLAELCGVVNALIAIFILKEFEDKSKIRIFMLGTAISFLGAIWLSILKI